MSHEAQTQELTDQEWATQWLAGVADGSATMSQRKLTSIDKHGGLEVVKAVAWNLGVHLVQLQDEKGDQLVAASLHPFKVIC